MAGGRVWTGELGPERPGGRRSDVESRRRTEKYGIAEASPAEAIPVLRKYLTDVRVVRPYFDAMPDAPDEVLEAELARHPVLRLVPQARSEGR